MTQDPKKLPSWLSGDSQPPNEPPSSEPPPSDTPEGDDADVPPWLRGEQPPEPPQPSKLKRVAPPPDREGTGSLPPWLAGADEEAKPKSYKIGGTELSEDYFAAADNLADSADTGMTFDAWIADQEESRREKDIEEEIPDDLLDVIANEPPPPKGTGMLKSTGQLPDWFLGLESLDTTEAPEWFQNEDEEAPPAAAAPLWMSDMMNDEPDEPADELPPADEIGSFFSSLGGLPDDEEETPEIDWYDQGTLPDDAGQTLNDDFFANLVGGAPTAPEATANDFYAETPNYAPQPSYDAFEDFDDFDRGETPSYSMDDPPARGTVEIPQNELDAFLSDFDSQPAAEPVSLDDIEDPELDWLDSSAVSTPEPYVPPEPPAEAGEESVNWLSELQGIVAGATRILPTPEEDVSKLGTQEIRISAENAPAAASAAAEDFRWPELSNEAEPEPAAPEPPAQDESWLNDIYLSDELLADAEPPPEAAPTSVPRSRLTDRLYRDAEPPAPEPSSEWESLTSAINDDSLFGNDTDAEAETSGYSLFDETPTESSGYSLFGDDEDSAEAGDYSLFDEEPASATEASSGYSLFEDDEPSAQGDEDNVLASDLQTGWLRQDLFSDDEPTELESAQPSTAANDDFFSKLANDSDSNVLFDAPDTEQGGWNSDALFADTSDNSSLYDAQPANPAWQVDEQQPADSTDDDFFAALDFGDEAAAIPTQTTNDDDIFAALGLDEDAGDDDFLAGLNVEAAEPEAYEPWQGSIAEQAQATSDETEDDFFAAMGFEDVSHTASATEPELYDPWSSSAQEQPTSAEVYDPWNQNETTPETPAAAGDDIFAALGISDAALDESEPEDDGFEANWSAQKADADADETISSSEDDFFARLNMTDDAPAAEPELYDPWQQPTSEADDDASSYAMPGTDELSASWLEQDAESAVQETANATDDDFFASLNFGEDNAETTPANDLPFDAWAQNTASAAQDDDFFATLGTDAGAATPENTQPDLYEQWQDEGASEGLFTATDAATELASADDDFFASLGMDGGAEFARADDENLPDFLQQADAYPTSTNNAGFEEVPEDFFSVLDIGGRDDDAAELPNDDLFAQWQAEPEPDPNDTGITPDDFFASLGMDNSDSTVQSADDDDPFANWDTGTKANIPPSQDFFAALDTMGDEQPSEWDEAPPQPDFFASLAEPEPEPKAPPAFTDVDDYLASLGDDATTGMLRESMGQNQDIDLDKLFAEPVSETPKAPSQAQLDLLPGADEDWLAQLHTSVGEVSASAIVRQKEDRPVEELPERLQRLRALSGEMPEPATEDLDALAPAPDTVVSGTPTLGQDTALTQEQQKRVEMLRALVPSERKRQDATRLSAIEATYDSPFMADLEDTPEVVLQPAASEKAAKPKRARRRRRKLNIRFDRFLVALVLGAAVVLPFIVPGFRIGSLPPASFAAGSNGQTAFDQIEALESGDLVLVGVEYGSASAAELDSMTEALLRHIIMKSAYPVLISSNPVGLLRSESRLNTINQDIDFLRQIGATQPLIPNNDYYIVRYLPGSVLGLRAFSGDTANLLLSDIHGQATNLVVRSMSDFALVAVVTDRAEDLRGYAEQIAPLTGAPLLSAVSYGAAPLVEPYASALDGGLLVGYADAYTYTDLLGMVEARSIANRVRIIPTPEPTQPAPQQEENAAEATLPAVRATGIRATPTIAATPTPALDTATVIATGSVNMRIGPSTDNPVLTAVPSGTTLPVIGYNPDRSWVNVALPDGRTGWISASLLSISEAQSAAPKQELYGKRQQVEEGEEQTPTPRPPTATRVFPTLARTATSEAEATDADATTVSTEEADATSTPRPTRTALPTATRTPVPTAEPTEAATPEATPEATVEVTEEIASAALPPPPPSPGYRDERWYAMNLGVIASALIITLGMVINLLRGLLRRGRRA